MFTTRQARDEVHDLLIEGAADKPIQIAVYYNSMIVVRWLGPAGAVEREAVLSITDAEEGV